MLYVAMYSIALAYRIRCGTQGVEQYMTHRPRLPAGYWVERDADILVLHRPDDSVVAAFSARGAEPAEIERAAREDAEQG